MDPLLLPTLKGLRRGTRQAHTGLRALRVYMYLAGHASVRRQRPIRRPDTNVVPISISQWPTGLALAYYLTYPDDCNPINLPATVVNCKFLQTRQGRTGGPIYQEPVAGSLNQMI